MMQFHPVRRLLLWAALAMPLGFVASGAWASVEISAKPTKNMLCTTSGGGICVAVADDATLNATALAGMLNRGDVLVTTGKQTTGIRVTAPVTWASTSHLTLNSAIGLRIEASIIVAGTGGLSLAANSGGLSFSDKGSVKFWDTNSELTINDNPYVLVSNLVTLGGDVTRDPNGNFALANDYNAHHQTFFASPVQDQLRGRFEGLGNTISNIRVKDHTNFSVGLFSNLGYGSEVENLHLVNMKIRSGLFGGCASGALAGMSVATIRNVQTAGEILSQCAAGGLAGSSAGVIENSMANCIVVGSETGGLVGFDSGSIADSRAGGTTTGPDSADVGGLVGFATGDTIDRSFATGASSGGADANVGGLVGRDDGGLIENSYAMGSATGSASASVGGLVGYASGGQPTPLNASYSTATISSGGYAGGLIGFDAGDSFQNTYWDLDTSGIADPGKGAGNVPSDPGITGLTDTQLKSALPSGFDPAIWGQSPDINNGYPYLLANPPPQ